MDFCQNIYKSCFPYLSEEAAKALFTRLELKTFQAGDRLPPLFCIITAGALDIVHEVKTGGVSRAHTLARIGVGSFVGEGLLLGYSEFSCRIVAAEKTSIVVLSKEHFDQLMDEEPAVTSIFLKKLLYGVHQRLVYTSDRLARVL